MRSLCLALFFASTTIVSSGQSTNTSTGSSDLEVVRFSWSKERIGWENDPFRGPIENFDEMRARTRNEKRIADAKRGGGSAEVDRLKRDANADSANIATQHRNTPSRYVFMYKATVKNLSKKTVKSIDWDYIFMDRASETELGRQQFTSEEKIGPGKSKELSMVITKPPTQTISLTSLNLKENESLLGLVVIVRIEYADGMIWELSQ